MDKFQEEERKRTAVQYRRDYFEGVAIIMYDKKVIFSVPVLSFQDFNLRTTWKPLQDEWIKI